MISWDISKFTKRLEDDYQPRLQQAAAKAVAGFGEIVVGKAQQLAPVDTGKLKDSGVADEPLISSGTITQSIGFNTFYAAAVHERTDLHHPQGQCKYLEQPMRELAPKLPQYVADALQKEGL